MGQATRTTKLLLDLGKRAEGGANTGKRSYLEETTKLLNAARAFYVSFFLAHSDKLTERVRPVTEQCQGERERLISSNELLTWAESLTVSTSAHPHPLPSYNFSERFPEFAFIRSLACGYHSSLEMGRKQASLVGAWWNGWLFSPSCLWTEQMFERPERSAMPPRSRRDMSPPSLPASIACSFGNRGG
jgi:hypothetical protein